MSLEARKFSGLTDPVDKEDALFRIEFLDEMFDSADRLWFPYLDQL